LVSVERGLFPGSLFAAGDDEKIMAENIQLTHADHRPSAKKFPLRIIADNISSPVNVGSLFRLCDAMGIEKLYLCGNTVAPPNTKISKISRSTEKYVSYESQADAETLIRSLKKTGALIIALEITSLSMAINSAEFRQALSGKNLICLILGSEDHGVSQPLLSLADMTVHIPMHGNNSSMNVISAASIACFEITRNLL
jgi:tRNA G18 (ribose-2'-O)-methylase SpoU